MNDQFEIIKINTGKTGIIDFALTNTAKEKLIQNGIESVKKYFTEFLPKKRQNIACIYEKILDYTKKIKKSLEKNKIENSKIYFSDLMLFLTENKEIIHRDIYFQAIETKKEFINNLYYIKILNIPRFCNKKTFLLNLDEFIKNTENHLKNLFY